MSELLIPNKHYTLLIPYRKRENREQDLLSTVEGEVRMEEIEVDEVEP